MIIINLVLLTTALGISYQSWHKQKKNYKKKLLAKHRRFKKTNAAINQKKSDNTKELISLSTAMGLSSIGYWIYAPLYYLALPFILFAVRKRLYFAIKLLFNGQIRVETLSVATILGSLIGQRFFIGSLLAFVIAIGDRLVAKVIDDSHQQLTDIYQEMPKMVWLLKDNVEMFIPLSRIDVGDILVVNAGELIVADGEIVWGCAGIDEHRLTGESIPVEKIKGDKVFAMTMVLSGRIHFQIEKAGAETTAMKIANIINETSDYKALTVLEYEAFSQQLIIPAFIISAFAWPLLGFNAAVGVLFAHPKERLKVAAPLSLLRHLKQAMDEGILIKDGRSLELLQQVDTIVFDKTGTLTEAQPHVGNIYTYFDYSEDTVLYFAAIAEHKQTHPIAQAILYEAKQRNISFDIAEKTECHLGYGIKVHYQGQTIVVGSYRFMLSEMVTMPESSHTIWEDTQGLIMVALDKKLIGIIELLPTIRPEAKAIIQQLQQLKQIKKTYIISGDGEIPTQRLAEELDIDHYFAQTLPQEKAALIKDLQQQGNFVCYIGDGINDAIAMKQAQVSISLSEASQLATDTAQILLLDHGITHLPRLFNLAQSFQKHMQIQSSIIFIPSLVGISAIFLVGMGMGGMMFLNMLTLSSSITYALIDKPKLLDKKHHAITINS